jgi:hypothetical protein
MPRITTSPMTSIRRDGISFEYVGEIVDMAASYLFLDQDFFFEIIF